MQVAASIFKAYDIRGIVPGALNEAVAEALGLAFGTVALQQGERSVAVGRDGRLSGPGLSAALIRGLVAAGIDVIDIGMATTPMLYFAASTLCNSGIQVTGSHNPKDYNGFKMVLNGRAIYGEEIQQLRRTMEQETWQLLPGGSVRHVDVLPAYRERIVGDVKLARPLKLVIDCGNGVGGAFAGELFRALGCDVQELFCEVDGNFPNHHPDPAHLENLQDLIRNLASTDNELGLAFDGDADRLGVVTKDGQVIFPDRQMMLFAKDVLTRHPNGQIIYDVKCTRNLAPWIEQHGGQALMWKTGHSLVKAKLKETGAPLAGEMSGHIFFKDRWFGFDDGLYTGARLLEILSKVANPSEVLNALPNALCTPELQLPCAEGEAFILLDKIKANPQFPSSQSINTIDGVRVEYADGFGLARPSNTTPIVVLRFEADSEEAIQRIQGEFKRALLAVKPDAKLPF